MPVGLTGARVLARVEEGKQAVRIVGILVGLDAGEGSLEVRRLEEVGLLLVGRGGEDEVLRDDSELVEDEEVR